MTITEKANQMYAEAQKVQELSSIYEEVYDKMKWNALVYYPADDEHEEPRFEEPDEDYYTYTKFLAYKEVLRAIEKLAGIK